MAVNLGGRGKKTPYEVTHLRVPVPIKEVIQSWVDEWKLRYQNGIVSYAKQLVWHGVEKEESYPLVEEICAVQDEKLKAIEKVVNEFRERSTHTERWKIADKLVNEIAQIL